MKISIIGGAGKMGTWFCRFFKDMGQEVIISDKNKEKLKDVCNELNVVSAKNNIEALKGVDLVMVSVLPQHFEAVTKEIGPHVKNKQKVMDITSLKKRPVDIMHTYVKEGTILGTHPVFGPSSDGKGENFVLTPINQKEHDFANDFKKMLEKEGFNVFVMSPEKHDELMSVVLGLSHFIGMATGLTFSELDLSGLKKVAGPSFNKLLSLVENVADSDPEFYSYLQTHLPSLIEKEESFLSNAKTLLNIVKNNNREKFAEKMKLLKNKFDQ